MKILKNSLRRADARIQILVCVGLSILASGLTAYLFNARVFPIATKTEQAANIVEPESDETKLNLPSRANPIRSLKDFNEVLVGISEQTKPSIVTVFTEQVVKTPRRMIHPFFGAPGFDDFFDGFFGPRGQRPQQPEMDEFRRQGLGSGVIISKDGFILTNNHVIAEADQIRVRTLDNKTYDATVVGRDPKTDIAVIRISAKDLTPVRIGNSDQLRVGEIVLAVGSPMNPNLAHTVTQGIVSAKGRSNVGLADYEDFIQTDAAINPGNSGGALVNIDGELIGINTAIVTQSGGSQGIGFSVPINMARAVMDSLIEKGEVVRGWLGVVAQDLTEELVEAMGLSSKKGVLVADVEKSGPADKAGLRSGDVILEIDGKAVSDGVELRNRISQMSPGKKINLTISRAGKKSNLDVTLERMPGEAGKLPKEPTEAQVESSKLLGFRVTTLSDEILGQLGLPADTKGVMIAEVDQDSAAARSGLQRGDVIVSVNRNKISSVNDFIAATKNLKKGQSILFQVTRRGTNIFVAFQLK